VGRVTPNEALAIEVVTRLWAAGARTFCVCPGGRNAPIVEVLERLPAGGADVLSFFEERSASFFALGRARRDLAPVAVITTSGTAAAELLPAMIEAHYSAVPLVAVTADRPALYRGTGAPQSIEQVNLFGAYAHASIDLERPGAPWDAPAAQGPWHLNVCFDEPLLADVRGGVLPLSVEEAPPPSPVGPWHSAGNRAPAGDEVHAFLQRARSPVVIVGALQSKADRDAVVAFCRTLGAPVLAEASSLVGPALGPLLLRSGGAAARRGFSQHLFDSAIRLGDIPSFRLWRDLEVSLRVPVLSVSRKPWRGLTHGTHVTVPPGGPLPLPAVQRPPAGGDVAAAIDELFAWDRRLARSTEGLLARFPASEPALVRRLSETIPGGSFVYLGNSLPIREWNRFSTPEDRAFSLGENRGANGIDGQVSTFLGWAQPGRENWAVLGDLTALYDLPSLWALRHLESLCLRVVVINNGGGRIFQRMFRNARFQNRHETSFAAWAALWGVAYHAGLPAAIDAPAAVVEVVPDDGETDAFWTALAAETRG
jgi:2-succinyl-5-enolpyruvyl-6-hydroxy-3-cyclohexene-1-carboxylate synthase